MKKSTVCALSLPVTLSFAAGYAIFRVAADSKCNIKNKFDMPEAQNEMNKTVEYGRKKLDAYQCDDVYIRSRDGLKLHGRFYTCENAKRTVIHVHGYHSDGEFESAREGWIYLANGCNLLAVDHRASGKSEGRYVGFGTPEKYDLLRWIYFVNRRCGNTLPVWLSGVSMGGATVMMASALNLPENVKGIIDDCGYTSFGEILRHVITSSKLPYFPFEYTAAAFFRLIAGYNIYSKEASAIEAMRGCKLPVLFIHGGNDSFVPPEMSRRNYNACISKHKKLVIIEGAEHARSYDTEPELVEREIIDFINENE